MQINSDITAFNNALIDLGKKTSQHLIIKEDDNGIKTLDASEKGKEATLEQITSYVSSRLIDDSLDYESKQILLTATCEFLLQRGKYNVQEQEEINERIAQLYKIKITKPTDELTATVLPVALTERDKTAESIETLFSAALPQMVTAESQGNYDKIFEIENQLRLALEIDFPGKEKYQQLYEKEVSPCVKRAKKAIRSIHSAAKAAAAKGQAVQAGIGAIAQLAEKNPIIKKSVKSLQDVFLLIDEGVVFKRFLNARAEEEEQIINSLFDLISNRAVTGTFKIENPSLHRYGIQISRKARERGFKFESLSSAPTLLAGIKEKISERSLTFLKQVATKVDSSTLYLSPDLNDEAARMAYEQCENFKWSYTDKDHVKQKVDFKTLHALYLRKEKMTDIVPALSASDKGPVNETLKRALNVSWQLISPELMYIDPGILPLIEEELGIKQESEGTVTRIRDIYAKPFISEMIIMKDLSNAAREAALQRLTDSAQVNAVLTSELQFLDMHGGNLGIAPEPNEAYEHFKDLKFSVNGSKPSSFKYLITSYLEGRIDSNTRISFKKDGSVVNKTLRELPELQEALNVKWKLVIFDTDLSLYEDNRLLLVSRELGNKNTEEHTIPLCSVLLKTDWKDRPLSEKAIQTLMNSDERDARVKQWTSKEDAPIYKRLSSKVRKSIQDQLIPIISKYSHSEARSEARKKNKQLEMTMQSLRNQFVDDISDISKSKNLEIWQEIENDLSFVPVRKTDTWETLAKRHHQDIDTIKKLNPEGLIRGKIKINYNLTAPSPEALKKRKKIAAQLFPRITFRQQAALLERQQSRKNYLSNYRALTDSTFIGEELFKKIESFIKEPTTPLSSVRKEELLALMASKKKQFLREPTVISAFKQALCLECQLTYFNLTKAMYPLLADVYTLNQWVYGSDDKAGEKIGLNSPLEETIKLAKSKFSLFSPGYSLARHLEKQIGSIKNPAFFMYCKPTPRLADDPFAFTSRVEHRPKKRR